jgi:hypothetical protein
MLELGGKLQPLPFEIFSQNTEKQGFWAGLIKGWYQSGWKRLQADLPTVN